MKKCMLLVFSVAVMIVMSGAFAFASGENDPGVMVTEEETSQCQEFDITNHALESYLNGISDPVKQDLLEKYFYLPSTKSSRVADYDGMDVVSQAKAMTKLSNVELKEIVDKIEADIPKLIETQQSAYEAQQKELSQTIRDSARSAGTYSYQLYGAMPSASGDVAWIKSNVKWQVDRTIG